MIGKIIKTIILFLFLTGVEIFIIFFLSVLNTDNFFVKYTTCVFTGDSPVECNPVLNYFTLIVITFVDIVLAFFLGNSPIFDSHSSWKDDIKSRLSKIQVYYASNDSIKLKQGLIEADKLLDFTTQKMRIKGEKYYDRIQYLSKLLPDDDYKKIKKARWVRNQIVHEIGYEISNDELQKHFWNIRKVILKVLK